MRVVNLLFLCRRNKFNILSVGGRNLFLPSLCKTWALRPVQGRASTLAPNSLPELVCGSIQLFTCLEFLASCGPACSGQHKGTFAETFPPFYKTPLSTTFHPLLPCSGLLPFSSPSHFFHNPSQPFKALSKLAKTLGVVGLRIGSRKRPRPDPLLRLMFHLSPYALRLYVCVDVVAMFLYFFVGILSVQIYVLGAFKT